MILKISYKNSVIGLLSEGKSIALHLNGQKLTEDLVVRGVDDAYFTWITEQNEYGLTVKFNTYTTESNEDGITVVIS